MAEATCVRLSVVVPVMNEEESAPALAEEITSVLDRLALEWECVWVNDGSRDRTLAVLTAIGQANPRHRVVDMDGNFGQSAAMATGFRLARGELVVTLDGDGQNDPADIPRLFERFGEGDVDMVNGVRARRRDSWVRKLSSRVGNGFRNWLTRETVSDVGCSIRLFRRECLLRAPLWRGMHRFIPTLARMQGYRITEIPVNHRPRTRGVTKYGIGNRLWVGLADCFAVRWMQWRLVWPRVRGEAGPRP